MKVLVVVSEFPKITETFAILNVLHYLAKGHDARVYHLKPFRHHEVVHREAQPVVERAFTHGWLLGPPALALVQSILFRPAQLFSVLAKITVGMRSEPIRLLATLAIVPKSLALGRYAKREGVDHIHGEFASHPATAAWIASEVYGIPFSFSAHMYDIFVSQCLLAEKSRKAEFVRVISEFNREFLAEVEGFDVEKLTVIRCGVSSTRFPARDVSTGADRASTQILYVGSLVSRKGVDVLLAALAKLKSRDDWHLTVLGGGPEGNKLEAFAEMEIPERVTFLGPATMDEVKEAMYASDLLVVSSRTDQKNRSEGIPVVCMEALAAECPVIAPRLSGIPELIRDGETGYLFSPGNVAELAEKVEYVIENLDDARRIASKGRKLVFKDYDIDKNAERILQLMTVSAALD